MDKGRSREGGDGMGVGIRGQRVGSHTGRWSLERLQVVYLVDDLRNKSDVLSKWMFYASL